MTRTETERLAVLEIEFKHVSKGMIEQSEQISKLIESNEALRTTIAGWDNQFRGGKTVLAALFAVSASVGGGIVWLFQHLPFPR